MSLERQWTEAKSLTEVQLRKEVEGWEDWPKNLGEACEYALMGGGKRFRPVLSLLVAESLGHEQESVLPWAVAVEMIHTYSLVHDDLPAMDNDDYRRGRPTVHRAFGEAMAILVGDALLTRAFGIIGDAPYPSSVSAQLIRRLASAAGAAGMVGGQVLDMTSEFKGQDAVYAMQRLKTGALIRVAAEGAAIALGCPLQTQDAARKYGEGLGLLFQITDDILDREQDADDGKNLLSHLTINDVYGERDRVADDTRTTAAFLEPRPGLLDALVDRIANRDA